MRPILLAAGAALIAVVGSAVFILDRGPTADAQTTVDVAIGDNWFCNASFANGTCDTNITAGDTVVWTNTGTNPHTVTECGDAFAPCPQSGGFDSGTLTNGQTFSRPFPTPGTYEYFCFIHGNVMQGRVIVAAAQQQTPSASPTASASPAPGSPTTAPTGTGAPTPTPSRAPAAAPATGGSPADGGASWLWLVATLGGTAVVVLAATGVGLLRRR